MHPMFIVKDLQPQILVGMAGAPHGHLHERRDQFDKNQEITTMTIRSITIFAGTIIISTLLLVAHGDIYNEIKTLYVFDEWYGKTQTNYVNRISNWIPNLHEFGVETAEETRGNEEINGRFYHFYELTSTNRIASVSLQITEAANINDAHMAMMEAFYNSSAIQPFPSGNNLNIGDRCYTGYPTNSSSAISFTRNNVFIQLISSDLSCSVLQIAHQLDLQLLDESFEHNPKATFEHPLNSPAQRYHSQGKNRRTH